MLATLNIRSILKIASVTIGIGILTRIFVIGVYKVPSSSMHPTLLAGDFVLVDKVFFKWTVGSNGDCFVHEGQKNIPLLRRGQVIAFERTLSENSATDQLLLVKRIAGVAGDTIAVRGKEVWFGDKAIQSGSIDSDYFDMKYCGPLIIPYDGMKIDLDETTLAVWRDVIQHEGNRIDTLNRIVFLNGNSAPSYVFKENYYYVLGDNHSDSYDSRYWGLVSEKQIVGRPFVVYWSEGNDSASENSHIRFSRFGTVIH